MVECIYDLDWPDDVPNGPKSVEFLCKKPNKPTPEVQDPLEIINLGTEDDPKPIQLSGLLETGDQAKIVDLLHEFKDCFAWHDTEMPGLDPSLVEHRMPIKEGYKPVKQASRRISKEIEEKVKEEIKRLVKAEFIRPAKYVEWLANIVPILKALTNVIRCCVDYRNINEAMPMANLSIDAIAKHKVLSFMDGNAGYNQIKMAKEDIHKTTFRCSGHVGTYEYVVMPFKLKNTGVTYQRAMNAIFHDLIEHNMEVYIDDIVVKFKTEEQHLEDYRQTLVRMRILRNVLLESDRATFWDSMSGGRQKQSSGYNEVTFSHQQSAVAKATREDQLLKEIYCQLGGQDSVVDSSIMIEKSRRVRSIGSLLAQNNEGGKEQAIYYLSKILTEVEIRYTPVEKLCLALYFTACKLRHYMLPCHFHIIAKTDVIKYMLSKPMLVGRIRKWILTLSEFSFPYVPQRAIKGQAIADFLTEH
ncbi:unnamed protein product [Malus baccata var. baccata]